MSERGAALHGVRARHIASRREGTIEKHFTGLSRAEPRRVFFLTHRHAGLFVVSPSWKNSPRKIHYHAARRRSRPGGSGRAGGGLRGPARAPATDRAYQSDWSDFVTWCRVVERSSVPADPSTIGAYLTDRAGSRK